MRRSEGTKIGLASMAVAVGMIAAGWGGPIDPASGYTESSQRDDAQAAGPCDPEVPLSDERACDPADELRVTDSVMKRVKKHAGRRFGGAWVDRSDPEDPVMKIAITEQTEVDQLFVDSLTGSDPRIQVVGSELSAAELVAVSDAIADDLAEEPYPFMVGPDAPADSVENVDTRTTYPKHTGGRHLVLDQISGSRLSNCTSAFTIKSDNGAFMGLTAGHCASGYLADKISIGNDYLSRSGINSYRGPMQNSSDAMRYSLADGADRDDNIFVNGSSNQYRDLQPPRYTMDTLDVGDHLCFQGVTSNNGNCGNVRYANVNVKDDEGHVVSHQFVIDYPCAGGDSGGPMYHVRSDGTAMAAGVVKGAGSVGCFFSQIGYALDDVNASLYYR